MNDFADRAWAAYLALPRMNGELETPRSLEEKFQISNGTLGKIFSGRRQPTVKTLTLRKVARALQVSLPWLVDGEGKGPRISQLPPRPGKVSRCFEMSEAARRAASRVDGPAKAALLALAEELEK